MPVVPLPSNPMPLVLTCPAVSTSIVPLPLLPILVGPMLFHCDPFPPTCTYPRAPTVSPTMPFASETRPPFTILSVPSRQVPTERKLPMVHIDPAPLTSTLPVPEVLPARY